MATECGIISAGLIAAICGKAPASGSGKRVFLLNYDDIDRAESTVTGDVLTALVLKTGKVAYLFESLSKATTGEATFARGTYFNLYDHAVTLRVFTKNQVSKNFINVLADARIVAVVENNEEGDAGEVKFEVYGWDSGLTLAELPFTTTFADSVVYSAKVASDDDSKEGQLPKSFFVTNSVTTEQALTALITPVTGG